MYDLLKQEEANRIRFILENSPLLEPIQYCFFEVKYQLDIFNL